MCQTFGRLLRHGGDKMGMSMAQDIDRDACGEVEVAVACRRKEIGALSAFERDIDACIGSKNRRHSFHSFSN